MNKEGFTLAEVWITLGIVGVIAALTAPGLILSSRHEANASKLAVNVANLENAFTTAIPAEGVDTLADTEMWGKTFTTTDFAGELGKYLHITGADSTINYTIFPIDSSTADATLTGAWITGSIPIMTKNGAIIYIRKQDDNRLNKESDIVGKGGSLVHQVGTVAIDVNGKSEPNQYGRDVFVFRIGEDGILFPQGGKDVSIFVKNGGNNSETGMYYKNTTDNDFRCNASKGTGLGCTARVVEEGYKISY